MLTFITILSILAMGFCVLIVFSALFAGTYLKIQESACKTPRAPDA